MNLKRYLPLAAVLIIGFLIRLQNLTLVFSDTFYPQGFDSYYLMRLVDLLTHTREWPEMDHYINYPFGYKIDIPPGFIYILSIPILLLGEKIGKSVDAFIPVILSLISTLLVYLIAKEIIKDVKGDTDKKLVEYYSIFASFFFTVSPVLVYRSVVGFVDHHMWVITLVLTSIYLMLKKYQEFKRKLIFIVLGGVFLALLSISWIGAPIYASLIAVSLLMWKDPKELRLNSISFAIPVISLLLKPEIGLAFFAIFLFVLIGSFAKTRNLTFHYLCLCMFIFLIIYFLQMKELSYIKRGLTYILETKGPAATIVEMRSFQIMDMLWITGFLVAIFAFPALLIQKNVFINTFFVSSLVLTLFRLRFADIWTFPVAILAAFSIYTIIERSLEMEKTSKPKRKRKEQTKKDNYIISRSDIAAIIFLLLFITAPSIVASATSHPLTDDWRNTLEWIRENTEPTSYYLQPDKQPEYSIMSWWNYGNWIIYVAKRPVVSNNFVIGAMDSAKFFLAQNEEEAMKIVKKRGVRYVITTDMEKIEYYFASIMVTAGINPEKIGLNKTYEIYNNSMFYKLHVEDAKNLEHFTLIKVFGGVKIFRVES